MSRAPVDKLIRLLARLPGIGEKSGARLAYFILNSRGKFPEELAAAIIEARNTIKSCSTCNNPDTQDPCEICADDDRDRTIVMVVEEPQDVTVMDKAGVYDGLYHVLGGALSPLAGRGPEDLSFDLLLHRLSAGEIKEVVIATNPSVEGDATAAWMEEQLAGRDYDVKVTRLARGMPVGSQVKYMDELSLRHAVKGRT